MGIMIDIVINVFLSSTCVVSVIFNMDRGGGRDETCVREWQFACSWGN